MATTKTETAAETEGRVEYRINSIESIAAIRPEHREEFVTSFGEALKTVWSLRDELELFGIPYKNDYGLKFIPDGNGDVRVTLGFLDKDNEPIPDMSIPLSEGEEKFMAGVKQTLKHFAENLDDFLEGSPARENTEEAQEETDGSKTN